MPSAFRASATCGSLEGPGSAFTAASCENTASSTATAASTTSAMASQRPSAWRTPRRSMRAGVAPKAMCATASR